MFLVKNELHTMDLRRAHVKDAVLRGGDLIIEFGGAVVIGHSIPELPDRTPCSRNGGEDRYAQPSLWVTLRHFSCGKRFLTRHLKGSYVLYDFRHDPATHRGHISFFSRFAPGRWDVDFTASSNECRWEGFGEVSEFVKDYRFRLQNQKNRGDTPLFGLIDEKSFRFYTRLKAVFDAIGNAQLDYNWLITDSVCYPNHPRFTTLFDDNYCWLTGEELTQVVEKEDFQWIWAVLSGFPKDVALADVLKHPLPYADGYTGFWENPIALQHPLSEIEIVPWDSSLVLLLSKDKEITDRYRAVYPQAEDLEEYNRG